MRRTWCGLAAAIGVLMMAVAARAKTIVYVSNADSHDIYVMALDEKDGSASVIEKAPVPGTMTASPLALTPDHRFLFVALRSEPYSVSSFAVDPGSGKLKLIKTSPLADNMAYLATDRTGKYLFAASYAGKVSSVNAIGANGEVSEKPLAVLPTGAKSHLMNVDPSNKFVFVNNLGDDVIYQYKFNAADGAVVPNTPAKFETKKGIGPRHLVFHPTKPWVYCVNELGGSVSWYKMEDAGRLSAMGEASILPKDFSGTASGADLHFTPDGKFLYTSERTSSTLAAFSVDAGTGDLKMLGTYPTETQPRAFNIDPSGRYLMCVGTRSNKMSTYAIDGGTGALKKVGEMEVGRNPNWVEMIVLPG